MLCVDVDVIEVGVLLIGAGGSVDSAIFEYLFWYCISPANPFYNLYVFVFLLFFLYIHSSILFVVYSRHLSAIVLL